MGRCKECRHCDGYACNKIDTWLDGTVTFEDTNEKISVIEYGDTYCKDFETADTKVEKTLPPGFIYFPDKQPVDNYETETERRLAELEQRVAKLEKLLEAKQVGNVDLEDQLC